MATSIMDDNKVLDKADNFFGEGNELYVDFLNAHEKLQRQYQSQERLEDISKKRLLWRDTGVNTNSQSSFQWSDLDELAHREESTLIPPRFFDFFAVDNHPYLILRMENDDIRGVGHELNVVVQGAEWESIGYETPVIGQMCLIDLGAASKLSLFEQKCSISLDRDGSMSPRIYVDPAKYYSSASLLGELSAVSRGGVLRGWATITSDRDNAVPLTALIDGVYEAHFYAREPYGGAAHLKQFSFHLPSPILDGNVHIVSLFHAGVKKPLGGASSVLILATPSAVLVMSAVSFDGGRFSINVASTGEVPLAEQSASIDSLRTLSVRQMLRSPSWILSAPLRFFMSRLRGVSLAPATPASVTVDRRQALSLQLASTKSWRLTKPLRKVMELFSKPKSVRLDKISASGQELRFRLVKNGSVVCEADAIYTPNVDNAFALGAGFFSHGIEGDLSAYSLIVLSEENVPIAELSLARLRALIEGQVN